MVTSAVGAFQNRAAALLRTIEARTFVTFRLHSAT
jgi:hypothetical protein